MISFNWFLGHYWGFRGRRARAAGRYSRETLRLYWNAWQASGKGDDLLSLLLFRRDLGLDLTYQWSGLLSASFNTLGRSRRVLACSLLLEFNEHCSDRNSLNINDANNIQLPATLHCVKEFYSLTSMQQSLVRIYDEQVDWQNSFHFQLCQWVKAKGICVVGNAANMTGSFLGEAINRHGCIVRFNVFYAEGVLAEDVGEGLDVWCVTPSFKSGQKPSIKWSVLLGPELQFRTVNWSGFVSLLNDDGKILTVPKVVWRGLVKELGSPPSAGIAFLAYLRFLLGSFEGISVAGFGGLTAVSSGKNQVYHHTTPKHKASPRHNWAGEQKLMHSWLAKGLTSLHDK
uniref:Uncharacterized protein n=1 Tax=uncultured Thiotrichaceae bacterium TaxID=298394 RepID=A0A6S6U9B9_9GAMM|nr:MAG: Unknown protein [uncultured Thiotrichaceae bacterium]